MKKLFYLLSVLCALCLGMPVRAAEGGAQAPHDVRVVVSDAQGAIPGASVFVKGTTTGAITNMDGVAVLNGISDGTVLAVSCIGYVTKEITVNGETLFEVRLEEDRELLDEVVVVGYGVQKKESLTSAISQISSDDITVSKNTNATIALQGKVPGLLIRDRNGRPGALDSDISLRGYGTPMIVVDGVIRSTKSNQFVMAFGGPRNNITETTDLSALQEINPEDIESISVLKDASATIYGLGAENGVILITTKKGNMGKPRVSLSAGLTMSTPTMIHDVVDWVDYMKWSNAMSDVAKLGHEYSDDIISAYEKGDPNYTFTDWYDLTEKRIQLTQKYNASLSGGTDKVKYHFGAGFNEDKSSLRSELYGYKRYNMSGSVTVNLSDNFKATYSTSLRHTDTSRPTGVGIEVNIFYYAKAANPMVGPYTRDNDSHYTYAGENGNPVALLDSDATGICKIRTDNFQNTLDLNYSVPFIKGLELMATGAYDYNHTTSDNVSRNYKYYEYNTGNYISSYGTNRVSSHWMDGSRLYGRIQATYNNTFGQHTIGATLASEVTTAKNAYILAGRRFGTANDALFTHGTINSGLETTATNGGFRSSSASAGYIGRLTYNYAGKYMAEVMARYDGTYIYAHGHRWGFFPSYSLGWRVSEESFFKNAFPFINNFKIRWSDGKTGSVQGNAYDYIGGYTSSSSWIFSEGETTPGWSNTTVENTILTWADVRMMDAGIDWELWHGKFGGTFDWFKRTVNGLAAYRSISLPDFYGVRLPQENLDIKADEGLELSLYHNNIIGDLSYKIGASATFVRSRFTYLESEKSRVYSSAMDYWKHGTLNRWLDGRGGTTYHWAGGQFTSLGDTNDSAVLYTTGTDSGGNNSLVPGMYRLVDRNGNGYIDDDDYFYTWADDINPPLQYGLNMSASYKNFDLNLSFSGSALRNKKVPLHGYAGFGFLYQLPEKYTDSYRVANYGDDPWDPKTQWTAGYWPALVRVSDAVDNSHNATYTKNQPYNYINAAFLRLKSIELGYTFSLPFIKRMGISNLRAYFNGGNLLTFCNPLLKYADPEIWDANSAGGYYPLMKTYTFGVSVNF